MSGMHASGMPSSDMPSSSMQSPHGGSADPLVSVVMPAFDAAATIAESIHSVLDQTHRALELLVIDDRSRDATWDIVQAAAAADARVVPIRMPANGGVAAARNAGLEAARGGYVAFLDSDDLWRGDKLSRQLAHMRAGGARVCYTAYRRFGDDGRTLSLVRPPRRIDYADMLKSNRIGNLTGMYARALGDFRFRKTGHEDYVFWLQVVRAAGHAERVDDDAPLADYRVRASSLSSDKARAARWQWTIYRESEGLGRLRAVWYFAHYAAHALAKRA